MKKITSLFASVMFCAVGFAQSQMSLPANQNLPGIGIKKNVGNFINHPTNSTASSKSFWINYAVASDLNIGGPGVSVPGDYYLYWDSLPITGSGANASHNLIDNIAQVLDVNSSKFKSNVAGYNLDNTTAYTVDSMGIDYFYERAQDATVDTMIVKIYSNNDPANMSTRYFTGMSANFGQDTVFFKSMNYSAATNSPVATGIQTFKVLLKKGDTASYNPNTKYFNTNQFAVPAGKYFATSVTFHSGHVYNLNDSLKNTFYFISYEEQGTGKYPIYSTCFRPFATSTCDWNVSSIIRTAERYSLTGNPWNGYFVPSYAFGAAYGFENHSFYYKVTATPSGINELSAAGKLKVGQNIPNPFSDITTINYELNEAATVTVNVFDITGKKVQSIEEGKKSAGAYNTQINSANLEAGIYFYSVTAGENSITKKMTVIK